MDTKELFAKAVDEASGCVSRVEPSQLSNETPCTEWDLRKLLNHIIYELSWIPAMLASKTVAEVGDTYDGDLLGSDVQAAWKKAAKAALDAVKHTDLTATVHLSYADKPADYYLHEVSADVLIHGWDMGQAIGCSLLFDPQLTQTIYHDLLSKKDMITGSGLFGTEITVPEDANLAVKLLAIVGRNARADS